MEHRIRIPQMPMWDTFISLGLRWGEVATLRWADVDLRAATLTVRADVAKSGRARALPIDEDLAASLRNLRRLHSRATGATPGPWALVFLSPHGDPWRVGESQNALRAFRHILKRAGIPKKDELGRTLDIHALRTTCGTRLARKGVPPQVLQYLLGHASIQTTMEFYVFLRMEDAREALRELDPLPISTDEKPPETAEKPRVPWNKPGTGRATPPRQRSGRRLQGTGTEGLASSGPCRTRTCDQSIMSRPL